MTSSLLLRRLPKKPSPNFQLLELGLLYAFIVLISEKNIHFILLCALREPRYSVADFLGKRLKF